MSTPHISAEKGDFAKTVLMPGDPLRAKFIADTFLKDVRQVTGVHLRGPAHQRDGQRHGYAFHRHLFL